MLPYVCRQEKSQTYSPYFYMNLSDLPIDLSTFRKPIVTWSESMFVEDDAIYTNYVGYLQTSEGVFFTGTVFKPDNGGSVASLEEYQEGLKDGRHVVFSKDKEVYEEIYIHGRFIAWLDAEGKVLKGKLFEKELFIAWLHHEGQMLKEKCFQANGFEGK